MIAIALLFSMVSLLPGGNTASATDNLGLNVKGAILIDADSGKILYEKNANVTKIG